MGGSPQRPTFGLRFLFHPFHSVYFELTAIKKAWSILYIPPVGERITFLSMRTKWQLSALFLGAVLVGVPALMGSQPSFQSQDSGAKQDVKDAGHESKDAAKDAGHGVKQGTKKAYHKTKHGTKKAWHKTKDTTTGAANGAKEGAKQP